MDNIFYKPGFPNAKQTHFPYSREKLQERPIFPTYVLDGGAFFFSNDLFGTANSDIWLEKILSGEFFDYWKQDGKFDWNIRQKQWLKWDYSINEWEGHIWLHRLYILLPLAQAYLKTKDTKYTDIWFKIVKDWFENNPYSANSNLSSNPNWFDMQVAWRTINLVHSLYMFGNNPSIFTQDQWDFIYSLIKMQVNHLYTECLVHIKTQITGNHKLQIGMVALMVGTLFPEFDQSEAYLEAGKSIITTNMENAILDGVSEENAVSYAHFIARLYLESHLLLTLNGYEEIPGLAKSLQQQYEYMYQFSGPNGKCMQIGDAYALDALADIDYVNTIYPLTFTREKKPFLFEKMQLAVLRNSRFDLYVDAAKPWETAKGKPYGNAYCWHKHYGKPTFVAYADGVPMFVDCGCTNYDRGVLYTEFYKSTSHNTLTCEELPLEKTVDIIPTEVKKEIDITQFAPEVDCQKLVIEKKITHPDGRGFTWVRNFSLYEDRLEITDSVKATEKMHFNIHLNIPADRIGYYGGRSNGALDPEGKDNRTLAIRRNEKMQFVETDTPFTIECKPCYNCENKMDYVYRVNRRIYSDCFTEKTVLRLEMPK